MASIRDFQVNHASSVLREEPVLALDELRHDGLHIRQAWRVSLKFGEQPIQMRRQIQEIARPYNEPMIHQAIILAGGKGERMRPLTSDRPKPMVELGGRPLIAYQLTQMAAAGISEVVFACSYRREFLMNEIADGKSYNLTARYSIEESPLGRGGGIKKAFKALTSGWEDVLVTNGDNLWLLALPLLMAQHIKHKNIATIVVVPLRSPYGIVEFNQRHEISGFREKPVLPHWVNAGVYVFNKEIEPLLPDIGDHETETFPMLPKTRFRVFTSTDYWRGIDTAKDLTEAAKEVKEIFPS